jgi:peptidyl-prolyl cis-trans isomerase B (cyclophilin B)
MTLSGGLLMGCGDEGSDQPEAQGPEETSTVADAADSVNPATYSFTMIEGTGVEVEVQIDLAPIMVANAPKLTEVWSSIIDGHPETADCAENQTTDGVLVGAITFTNDSGFEPDYLAAQFFSPAHEFGSENAFGLEADAGGTICRSLQGGAISGGYSGSIPFQIVLSDLYGPNGFDQDRYEEQLRLFVTVDSSSPGSFIEEGMNTTTVAPEVDDERDLVLVLPAHALGDEGGGGSTEQAGGAPCEYISDDGSAELPPDPAVVEGSVAAVIETTFGDIDVTLDADAAPCAANSFVWLAERGYFDDTQCPRLEDAEGLQMLQCGDPTGTGRGGPGYTFADELTGDESYEAGTLAMASSGPGTNGSQFFLVYGDSAIPPQYTVFGSIGPEGHDVVREIAAEGADDKGRPTSDLRITGVTVS